MCLIVKGGNYKLETKQILDKLIDEYGDSIFRMCYLYLKDYQLAEDATQETFIKAMKSYDSFQNKSSEKTWLTRIAINCCKNRRRTRWFKTHKINLTDLSKETDYDFTHNIIEKHSMTNIVSSLKTIDREIILLYYYQDLSIKEISSMIGISENTAIQRLNRARNRLKKILLEVGYCG